VLEIGGRPVELAEARPRARAALRLLAAHAGRVVHVETLTEALWPGGDPVAGKRSLQVALSSLRGLLDAHAPGAGALIERRDNGYLLELPDGAESDVATFAAAGDACRAAARPNEEGDVDIDAVLAAGEEALAAYGGDLLPEEGPAEWVVPLRRSLARDAAEVAQLVAGHALGADRCDTAVAACTRGLEIDGYDDALWRLLREAHERGGDHAAAARVQERYRQLLSELGVEAS
jgi:DNA-binding SARP family transcriptional activator